MNVTELLVTGFNGDKAIFAANLTPEVAKTIFTSTDDGGDTTVESTAQRACHAFASVRELLDGLVLGPGQL